MTLSASHKGEQLVALIVATAALALVAAPARAAAPSNSRLSAHLIGSFTAGAQQIVAARPRVLKILDVHGPMLQAARAYKSGTPDGEVVLRIHTPRVYTRQHDPAASAQDFWDTVLAPAVNSISQSDRALIDYLEGPNECDSTPCWSPLEDAQWFNTFWVALAPLIGNAGFKPVAFSIPVGNPPGSTTYIGQVLDAIVPALRACKSYNGGWSYHSYTIPYTTDVNQETWYSLRYRQYYQYFATKYPDLSSLPLILTEGGVDGQSAEGGPGWRAYDASRYQAWLAWYDQQLAQDAYVVGCTLFQIGDPYGWYSFDLEPVAAWLAGHIAAAQPPDPPSTPTNLTAVASGPTSVQLTWTPSTGASYYNVRRSTNSGGPYTKVASPATNSHTDTGLTTGVTYYYVVSAVNASGESANSNPASATPVSAHAVNCGGAAAGGYAADAYYSGGSTYATTAGVDVSAVTDPAPQAVYQSERWASPSLTYTIPALVPGAPYTVRLHFAEIYFTATGQRRFHVTINGTRVLTDFDIVAAAEAANKAVVRSFTTTANASGQVIILLSSGSVNNPKANGIEVKPFAPAAPTGLTAAAGNAQVTLRWTASIGATAYTVKRSTADGGPYTPVATDVADTTYTNTGLTNGTTYFYVVSAVNAGGESPDSDRAGATPLPPPPPAPSGLKALPGDARVALSWNPLAEASGYNVRRAGISGGPFTLIAAGVNTTGYTDAGLANDTTYYYVVSAFNPGGEGMNSPQVLATPASAARRADFDGDSDVDTEDFSLFQLCFNGPNRAPPFYCPAPGVDLDTDSDVDLVDFSIFQACFNGPNRPAACP